MELHTARTNSSITFCCTPSVTVTFTSRKAHLVPTTGPEYPAKNGTFGSLTTRLNTSNDLVVLRKVPSIPICREATSPPKKGWPWIAANPNSRSRRFRTLPTIYLRYTRKKARVADHLRSVRRTKGGAEGGRTETGFDSPRRRTPNN